MKKIFTVILCSTLSLVSWSAEYVTNRYVAPKIPTTTNFNLGNGVAGWFSYTRTPQYKSTDNSLPITGTGSVFMWAKQGYGESAYNNLTYSLVPNTEYTLTIDVTSSTGMSDFDILLVNATNPISSLGNAGYGTATTNITNNSGYLVHTITNVSSNGVWTTHQITFTTPNNSVNYNQVAFIPRITGATLRSISVDNFSITDGSSDNSTIEYVSDVENGRQDITDAAVIPTTYVHTFVIPRGLAGTAGPEYVVEVSQNQNFMGGNYKTATGRLLSDFQFRYLCPNINYYARTRLNIPGAEFGPFIQFNTGAKSVTKANNIRYVDPFSSATIFSGISPITTPEIAHGAVGISFRMDPRPGVDYYQIQLASDPRFTNILWTSAENLKHTWGFHSLPNAISSTLTSCTPYYLRARYEGGDNCALLDGNNFWGRTTSFTMDGCPFSLPGNGNGNSQGSNSPFVQGYATYNVGPNPFNTGFSMKVPYPSNVPLQVAISSANGTVLESITTTTNNNILIGTTLQKKGMYFVLINYDGNVDSFKVLKN